MSAVVVGCHPNTPCSPNHCSNTFVAAAGQPFSFHRSPPPAKHSQAHRSLPSPATDRTDILLFAVICLRSLCKNTRPPRSEPVQSQGVHHSKCTKTMSILQCRQTIPTIYKSASHRLRTCALRANCSRWHGSSNRRLSQSKPVQSQDVHTSKRLRQCHRAVTAQMLHRMLPTYE